MGNAEIITITVSVLVFFVSVIALIYSIWSYRNKYLKNNIFKTLHHISKKYWSVVPNSNFLSIESNERPKITNILLKQGIHYYGFGEYILHLIDHKWYDNLKFQDMTNVLNVLSNKDINELRKYYKKIKIRLDQIIKKIEQNHFFDFNEAYGIFNREFLNFNKNNYIKSNQILLYFSNQDDSGIVKSEPTNKRHITTAKTTPTFPFNEELYALKFGISNTNITILAIFNFIDNKISKIKLYKHYPNFLNISLLESSIEPKERTIFFENIKDNLIQPINNFLYNANNTDFINKIIDISKSYHYIYCAINQHDNNKPNYSILKDSEFLKEKTHFIKQEIDFVNKFWKLDGEESVKKFVDGEGRNLSENHLILIFWEHLASV